MPTTLSHGSISYELRNIRYALDKSAIVAITDREGKITHVNDRFCEISKYPRDELLGKNHRIINSGLHSKDFFKELWTRISSGEVWLGEIRNRAKDGSLYWVHTTIVPFLDKNGQPEKYVSIRFEITQRKMAEDQLRIYAKRLETSNKELEHFASIAAHDLQEPLRKIRTFSERLVSKYREILPTESRDYLDRIEHSAARMAALIDDLLTYSRVSTQAQAFSHVNLNQTLKEVLSDLEVRIEQTKAKIEVGELPLIEGDPVQLRQLFQNLIANSLKFHKKGESPVVRILSRLSDNAVEIKVEDQGVGFDEKFTPKLFTIFQRLHGKDEYEGTGVGLAVCRRIIERHEGQITASSILGKGSTFTITLPSKQAEQNWAK